MEAVDCLVSGNYVQLCVIPGKWKVVQIDLKLPFVWSVFENVSCRLNCLIARDALTGLSELHSREFRYLRFGTLALYRTPSRLPYCSECHFHFFGAGAG